LFPHLVGGGPGPSAASSWVPGLDQVRSVTAEDRSACAVRGDGTALCWGENSYGQLPVTPDPVLCREYGASLGCNRNATAVPLAGVQEILLHAFPRTVVVDRAGALFLGCPVDHDHPGCTPLLHRVDGLPPVAKLVAAQGAYSAALCALGMTGEVHCLGRGPDTADGAIVASRVPVQIGGIDDAVDVALASDELCALRRGGSITCWGDRFAARRLPPVVSLAPPCALTSEGRVWCWGENGNGEMGLGYRNDRGRARDPAQALPVPGLNWIKAVSSSMDGTTCALSASGEVSCWGGLDFPSLRPTRISGLPPARQIWVGGDLACSLSDHGHVHCWRGKERPMERTELAGAGLLPSAALGSERPEQLCVVTPERRLRCQGLPSALPELEDVRELSLAVHHRSRIPIGCVVVGGGTLRCWGPPYCSEGADVCVSKPWNQLDTVLTEVRRVALDEQRGCAVRLDGTVWCWGSAAHGTFGGPYTPSAERVTHVQLAGL
jgi:hypothetical protein